MFIVDIKQTDRFMQVISSKKKTPLKIWFQNCNIMKFCQIISLYIIKEYVGTRYIDLLKY